MRSSLLLALGLVAGAFAPTAAAQSGAVGGADVPPPWDLTRRAPAEPTWAPLLRVRDAEGMYRDHETWGGTYAQLRAQMEAAAGDHAAALAFWDAPFPPRDSVGVLPDGVRAADALDILAALADTAQVVMVNERHHAASDRLLTLRLLPFLYAKGFRYFAAEAFGYDDAALNERAYPVEATGHYTSEPVFAEIVREARRLGYTLVPYEAREDQEAADTTLTPQQRRDRAQAQNLSDQTFRDDPDAKVLVHAGFGHVQETASPRWYPMAVYFREITGINPVTVDQTALSERSGPGYEHPAYRAAQAAGWIDDAPIVLLDAAGRPVSPAAFPVDVQVLTPRTTYTHRRPDWMAMGGRRVPVDVAVPVCADRWCYVEARRPSEPDEAIALDRAEASEAETVRLFVPPGQAVTVRVFGANGERLSTIDVVAPSAE